MTNYDEHPELFKEYCLIYDVIKQQIKSKGYNFGIGDIIDYVYEFFNIELTIKEIQNIQIYIKSKKKIHHSNDNKCKDKEDILTMEYYRLKYKKKKNEEWIKKFKF